jgi:cell division protein FtsB
MIVPLQNAKLALQNAMLLLHKGTLQGKMQQLPTRTLQLVQNVMLLLLTLIMPLKNGKRLLMIVTLLKEAKSDRLEMDSQRHLHAISKLGQENDRLQKSVQELEKQLVDLRNKYEQEGIHTNVTQQ